MDSILKDEPSVHTMPDGPESDSPSETASEPEVKADKGGESKPVETKASTKPVTETVKADEADEEGDPDPVDRSFEGLRSALTASRGDKRKLKKQWQEAEKRAAEHERLVAEMKGRLAAYEQMGVRQPSSQEAAKPGHPDFYADPDAHISAREKALREEFEARQFKRDADRSEKAMRRQHADYEEAKAAFIRATANNQSPWLLQRMYSDPDPAEVVYEEGSKLLGRGQPSNETEQLKARIAELEAAASAPAESTPKPAKTIPKPSNASARGTGASVKQSWSGPRSMNEILGRGH